MMGKDILYMRLIENMYFFFFNDTATTEIYTLSLHDALPILGGHPRRSPAVLRGATHAPVWARDLLWSSARSEEHTSELQSRQYLVCRLLLEKKIHVIFYSLSLLLFYITSLSPSVSNLFFS